MFIPPLLAGMLRRLSVAVGLTPLLGGLPVLTPVSHFLRLLGGPVGWALLLRAIVALLRAIRPKP
jgi:hypothetical protein